MENLVTERLIKEIENRPPLWDFTKDEYSHRELKRQCWSDLVDIFGGPNLTPAERREAELLLQKKWNAVRSCFTRELRRKEMIKTGFDSGLRKSEYKYFQHLQFLNKTISLRYDSDDEPRCSNNTTHEKKDASEIKIEVEDDIEFEENDPLGEGSSTQKPSHNLEEDEDKMFLMSMLSTLQNIPTSKKMITKIKLMTVLDEATRNLE